jgi:hypothetical protein
MFRMRRFYLLPALLAIAACSHTPVAVCPAPIPYSPEQQTQVADELETLPPDAMTRRFMTDYAVLRARLRSCQ